MKGRIENLKPWQPGQSGNPGGRPKQKPITDAYRELMGEPYPGDSDSRTWAQVIAIAVASKAALGDSKAAAQIADRLEGKPPQSLQLGADDGDANNRNSPARIIVQFVESDGNGRPLPSDTPGEDDE